MIKNLIKEPEHKPRKQKKDDDNNSEGEEQDDKPRRIIKSATDVQRVRLEKLMKNPEKPIVIPESRRDKDYMQSVPTFVRNVMGSSAGAGSGEFHVYRHLRRKEYARQKNIHHQSLREQLDEAYQHKLEENRRLAEEKTAKKRAKRLKKKQRAKRPRQAQDKKEPPPEESSEDEEDEEAVEKQNKSDGEGEAAEQDKKASPPKDSRENEDVDVAAKPKNKLDGIADAAEQDKKELLHEGSGDEAAQQQNKSEGEADTAECSSSQTAENAPEVAPQNFSSVLGASDVGVPQNFDEAVGNAEQIAPGADNATEEQ